jgi:CheY-like chemotaxis protein
MTNTERSPAHERFRQALIDERYIAGLQGHLATCGKCSRLAEHMRSLDELAASVVARTPLVPPGLIESILGMDSTALPPAGCETSGVAPTSGNTDRCDQTTVLLVEDDVAVAEMYRVRLEMDGHYVLVACDGSTAVQIAIDRPVSLVLLDIRLPRLDGLAVLEELRSRELTRNLTVVVLSDYCDKDLVDRALRLGASDYLIKAHTAPSSLSRAVAKRLTQMRTSQLEV